MFIGYPQIFIRFSGCNIKCAYCDEIKKEKYATDYPVEKTIKEVQSLMKNNPHSISLTGGEPLLQVDAIKELIPKISLPLYLDTNGTLASHLQEIVDDISFFSVDYKPGFVDEFINFMEIIKDKKNVFVKYIVTRNFLFQEAQTLAKILAALNPDIPLIIQPVTPFSGIKEKATAKDITRAYNITSKQVNTVRIIPQTHKFMGIK
ncbi:MAG: 7-carboxy-7-deazaguanine synthase QueE [bacterium]|nr:7-carboxy-7-deazaguanine synthase QueE [bacterium]